jgi:glutathione peroxidase
MKAIATLFAAASLPAAHGADLTAIPFKTLDGKASSLADFKGKVVLVVNTASKCGLTPQYEALEALHKKYAGRGFSVVAFPCNDFGNQEPGTAEEIQQFCKTRYDVSFPLMEKVHVKGPDQHPLYAALTGKDAAFPGEITWNFGKFLIGKDGRPLARFKPRDLPDAKIVTDAIEKALAP